MVVHYSESAAGANETVAQIAAMGRRSTAIQGNQKCNYLRFQGATNRELISKPHTHVTLSRSEGSPLILSLRDASLRLSMTMDEVYLIVL